jgi:hypothetical protein
MCDVLVKITYMCGVLVSICERSFGAGPGRGVGVDLGCGTHPDKPDDVRAHNVGHLVLEDSAARRQTNYSSLARLSVWV